MARAHANLIQPLGLVPWLAGVVALLWCVHDFYVSGRGTLAPWDPPTELVAVGLYRYTHNPMYVAVTLILVGWAFSFAVSGLYIYAVGVAIAFHLRVVLGEEPWLARTARVHGKSSSLVLVKPPSNAGRRAVADAVGKGKGHQHGDMPISVACYNL